jgi:hypothetical protein
MENMEETKDVQQSPQSKSISNTENTITESSVTESSVYETENNTDYNINKSIEKMDGLIIKLQEYTKINVSSMTNNSNTNNSNKNNKNIENKIIKAETPEYYSNEQLKFLNDQCQEKDNKIKIINNILNISIIVNTVLISYILGTWFY